MGEGVVGGKKVPFYSKRGIPAYGEKSGDTEEICSGTSLIRSFPG